MDKIQEFLQAQDKIIAKDRENTLISLGLFEKEYAPDGKFSRQYQKYDIVNGEKRYYREVAVSVSDEEWQSILERSKAVAEICEREELAFKKANERKNVIKKEKIMPNFKKEATSESEEKAETGRSRIALALRIAAVVLAVIYIFAGIIGWTDGYEEVFFVFIGEAALNFLLLFALAEILDYLAMLTAIAKGGHHITKN